MGPLPKEFTELAKVYTENGFSLWMVGGTSRDFLLGLDPDDLDFVTDATPNEQKAFVPDADYSFSKYGTLKVAYMGKKIDVTTLRVEEGYGDHRHPARIRFVKTLQEDYIRRDFTVNAIYIDSTGKTYDFSGGIADLKEKVLRFIGNPKERVDEDPLRIIRADRFVSRLGFSEEPETKRAIEEGRPLLETLNPTKVKMELTKGGKQ